MEEDKEREFPLTVVREKVSEAGGGPASRLPGSRAEEGQKRLGTRAARIA